MKSILLSAFTILVMSNYVNAQCNQLVWSDEFDGTNLDVSKWSYETGNGCPNLCGWGNGELEYYTEGDNIEIVDGVLTLTARREDYGGSSFTSGKLVTLGKFSQTYGRFEARMRMPLGLGLWPAFWMLSVNNDWPMTGEIDIMEYRGDEPNDTHGTLHYGLQWPQNRYDGSSYTAPGSLAEEFHVYAVEWTEDFIKWYVDDDLFKTETRDPNSLNPGNNNDAALWPWNSDFYIILNLAVGGAFAGSPGVADVQLIKPTFEIDYVRVYSGDGGFSLPTQIAGQDNSYTNTSCTFSLPSFSTAEYLWEVDGVLFDAETNANSIDVEFAEEGDHQVEVQVFIPATTDCLENSFQLSKTISVYNDECEFLYSNFDDDIKVSVADATGTPAVMSNPMTDEVNSSASVLSYTRNPSQQYDNMFLDGALIPNGNLFETETIHLEMDVLTPLPAGVVVELQIGSSEYWDINWPAGRHSTYRATTTLQNEWETLQFTLSQAADPNRTAYEDVLDRIVVLFNPDSYTGDTYYFDNVRKVSSIPQQPDVVSPVNYLLNENPDALIATGQNIGWYIPVDTLNRLEGTIFPLTDELGTFSYYATQTVNGCESPRAEIIVNVESGISMADTQRILLNEGLNLISFWLTPTESIIEDVLGSNIQHVQYIKDSESFWLLGQPDFLNGIDRIESNKAYLISVDQSFEIVATGQAVENPEVIIPNEESGYYMQGCPFADNVTFEDAIGNQVSRVLNIKNFEGYWLPESGTYSINAFEPGMGYFILLE